MDYYLVLDRTIIGEKHMKKRFCIGIIWLLTILLCACNNSETKNNNIGNNQAREFVSDWSEGNENYYGYGAIEDWNRWHDLRNYIIQDQTMYYVDHCDFKPKIYKKQIDSDSVSIVAAVTEENRPLIHILGVVQDYIYYEIDNISTNIPNSIYRIRTDGEQNEFLTKHCAQTGSPYIVGNQLFFMSYEQKGAQTYEYQLACMNVETKERKILLTEILFNDLGNDFLQFGYKDYLFCKISQPDTITGTNEEPTIIILRLDGSMFNIMTPGTFQSLIDPEKDIFTFKKFYAPFGEDHWKTMSLNGTEGIYDSWPYSRHSKEYKIELKKNVYDVGTELTIVYRNGMEKKLNDDRAWQVYAIGDGYVYYACNSVYYRIKIDGTGWEDVSWMYP